MIEGRCPHCHREGPAAEPCPAPACAAGGYHFIPRAPLSEADPDDPMIGRVVGDFLIVGVLGSGGFGNVHHVLQLPLRARPIQGALKRIRGGSADPSVERTLRERFESEADALASLSHPNVVRLLKAGIEGETPYLVLELVTDAETLERELEGRMRQGVGMPVADLVAITEQILNALEAAHSLSIVHRDVKPGNVMLQRVVGYDVFVRMLDFGLAKFIAESSETQRVMGTLDYMAPEQLRGRDIGPWTDLYALGLLVLAMLTGRPAFSSDRAVLINEKLDARYDPVRHALAGLDLPAEQAAFLRRATAFDRRERYASTEVFRRALREAFAPAPRDGTRKLVRTRDLAVAQPIPLRRPSEPPEERPTEILPGPFGAPPPTAPPTAPREPAPPREPSPPASAAPREPAPSLDPWWPARPPAPPASGQSNGGASRWPLLDAVAASRARTTKPPEAPRPRAPEPSRVATPSRDAARRGPVVLPFGPPGRSRDSAHDPMSGFVDTQQDLGRPDDPKK